MVKKSKALHLNLVETSTFSAERQKETGQRNISEEGGVTFSTSHNCPLHHVSVVLNHCI